jgi:hypothetical protein
MQLVRARKGFFLEFLQSPLNPPQSQADMSLQYTCGFFRPRNSVSAPIAPRSLPGDERTMRTVCVAIFTAAFLLGCSSKDDNGGAASKELGGSFEGMGGAGPGYDGSGQGAGPHGTVPNAPSAEQGQTGHSQTNTAVPSPNARDQEKNGAHREQR